MTIITRYKAAKLTGITEAVFSRMWQRQQSSDDHYEFFTDDGKVNIDSSDFTYRYHERIKPDILDKIKNPKPKTAPVKKVVKIKKEKLKKSVPKKKAVPKKAVKKKEKKIIETKTEKPEDSDEPKTEMEILRTESMKAKLEKVIIDKKKSEMELKKSRAELAEVETLGKTLIGYCIALNQTLLDQPRSYIDEFEMAFKKGKSKTDLTDIIRIPASAAIEDTIVIIKKELEKFRRAIKRAEKKRE